VLSILVQTTQFYGKWFKSYPMQNRAIFFCTTLYIVVVIMAKQSS